MQITNISFKTVISSATPTSFPIKIDYSIPLTPQSSIELVVNFLHPQQHILRQISSAILESYLNLKATDKRRKRGTEVTPSVFNFKLDKEIIGIKLLYCTTPYIIHK